MINHSERSDKCIDFTMMCVFFFVSVNSITSRNIMLQFQTLGVVSHVKVNILVFKKIEKNKKKMTEKRGFVRKTIFDQIDFFLWLYYNSKTNHCKYLKFSQNINVNCR
ncbi:hypothetical protein FWK35_00030332 [Aphis craccivora]|uniref:Uncharacterized protein n=1 Tax=Aphis craccivora TaxID=307492 RepID=A0A6G0Y815_APHCR|nr:hypothetical protein FWK35_00030332 [Aphis craccivora]